jgi:uncharacterized cupredoxin-like copper-binding protein
MQDGHVPPGEMVSDDYRTAPHRDTDSTGATARQFRAAQFQEASRMTHRPKLFGGVASIAIALVLAACSGTGSPSASQTTTATASGGGGGGTAVNVTETEFKIEMDQTSLPAGSVTFNVTNKGTIAHEFVVFKTDDAPDALPMASDDPEVNEDAADLQSMGEVEDVDPGASKSFTATLEPGKYVAICNVEGHYSSGMHVPFTVQ